MTVSGDWRREPTMRHKMKSILDKKMEEPAYRKRFEQRYPLFKLEVQILNAIEEKGWTLTDLAKAMHTHKGNISRDLSAGRIRSATLSRIVKIGDALGLVFFPLFVSEKKGNSILPKIHKLLAA